MSSHVLDGVKASVRQILRLAPTLPTAVVLALENVIDVINKEKK